MTFTNYDKGASDYIDNQKKFYSGKMDESRKILFREIGEVNGKRILDAGCGTGEDMVHFLNQGADVYGIDVAKGMVEQAKNRNPQLKNQLSVYKWF